MKAYKGFNKDLTCRDFQFKEGQIYIHEGDVVPCESGFHACTNPIDVLAYYPAYNGARYFEVECDGEIKNHNEDSKISCSQITVKSELNLINLIKIGVQMIFDRVEKNKPEQYTSGYQSTAATSGDYSTAATSGDYSTAATSGDRSAAICSGKQSIAIANGYKSTAQGAIGCYLVLTEYDDYGNLFDVRCAKVDGKKIKPDTLYRLENGEFVEV